MYITPEISDITLNNYSDQSSSATRKNQLRILCGPQVQVDYVDPHASATPPAVCAPRARCVHAPRVWVREKTGEQGVAHVKNSLKYSRQKCHLNNKHIHFLN